MWDDGAVPTTAKRGRQCRLASVGSACPSCWSAPKGLSMAPRPAVGVVSGIGPKPGHGCVGATEVRGPQGVAGWPLKPVFFLPRERLT
jgi:hypothetical protein